MSEGASVRTSFVERFGEDAAFALEQAAFAHQDSHIGRNPGTDPFKYVVCICIGFECVSKASYAEYHGITIDPTAFKTWVRQYGELASHDGDVDFLALFSGVYADYVVNA